MKKIPLAFLHRRLHSITGIGLVIFLIFHLLTNSQSIWHEEGFVRSVNFINALPHLHLIELSFLALPILLHGVIGFFYLFEGKQNLTGFDLSKPLLPAYPRNRAYTWQRWTSYFILIGLIAHVVHMRFMEHPEPVKLGDQTLYAVGSHEEALFASSFGAATLTMLRHTFKNPILCALYTLFVLSSCYHAFNGVCTFCITWGITISQQAQQRLIKASYLVMSIVSFLGLLAIWGSWAL